MDNVNASPYKIPATMSKKSVSPSSLSFVWRERFLTSAVTRGHHAQLTPIGHLQTEILESKWINILIKTIFTTKIPTIINLNFYESSEEDLSLKHVEDKYMK